MTNHMDKRQIMQTTTHTQKTKINLRHSPQSHNLFNITPQQSTLDIKKFSKIRTS